MQGSSQLSVHGTASSKCSANCLKALPVRPPSLLCSFGGSCNLGGHTYLDVLRSIWVLHSFPLLWQVAETVHTSDNACLCGQTLFSLTKGAHMR